MVLDNSIPSISARSVYTPSDKGKLKTISVVAGFGALAGIKIFAV
jgi:hypothetical protein